MTNPAHNNRKKMLSGSPRGYTRIKAVPDLIAKESVAALALLALSLLISVYWDAPLQEPANPQGIPQENVKAPWIFVGVQFMLIHMDPLIAGILLPFAGLILISAVPFIPYQNTGRNLVSSLIFHGIVLLSVILTILGLLYKENTP